MYTTFTHIDSNLSVYIIFALRVLLLHNELVILFIYSHHIINKYIINKKPYTISFQVSKMVLECIAKCFFLNKFQNYFCSCGNNNKLL